MPTNERIQKTAASELSVEKILGNNYEAHIGRLLEDEGYNVIYTGFNFGKRDNMIDLVGFKEKHMVFAQCKYHKQALTTESIDRTAIGARNYKNWVSQCFQSYGILDMLTSYSVETRLYCSHAQSEEINDYARSKGIGMCIEYIPPTTNRPTYDVNDAKYAEIITMDDFSYMEKVKAHLFSEFLNILPMRETMLYRDLFLKKDLCQKLKDVEQTIERYGGRVYSMEGDIKSLQSQLQGQLSALKSELESVKVNIIENDARQYEKKGLRWGCLIWQLIITGVLIYYVFFVRT